MSPSIAALAVLTVLAGCAADIDYPPERGISADIDASRYGGASSLYPGMTERSEPFGVFPWQLGDDRNQRAR
jgi:hypothetical protein